MKKRFITHGLALIGIAVFAFLSIASMASMPERVDNITTYLYPSGEIIWAPGFREYVSARAENAAPVQYRQEVRQSREWQFAGFDFEFNKMELSQAISRGTHRLGDMINNTMRQPGRVSTVRSLEGGGTAGQDGSVGEIVLIDPTKPGSYYPVYILTTVNNTVNVPVDNSAQYNQAYNNYTERHAEYIRMVSQLNIAELERMGKEVTQNDPEMKYEESKRREQNLRALPAGTKLIFAGYTENQLMVVALIDENNVFKQFQVKNK